MRLTRLIIIMLFGLASCKPDGTDERQADNSESILFVTTPVQSSSLLVRPTLKYLIKDQQMELALKLESLVREKITITEVTLNNSNGVNSSVENISDKKWTVPVGRDTTISTTINHISDKKLFHTIGLPGLIDSVYNLSVFYSIEGNEGIRVVNLVSKISKDIFLSYRNAYDNPVQVYFINTASDFNEKQRQFLIRERITTTTPFVHTTEQELAISGLNFRIRCFHQQDSLHTEIFIVNHSDMTIRMDTSKIEMIANGSQNGLDKWSIKIEKVTGSRKEVDILRKGDRVIIRLTHHVHRSPEKIQLSLTDAFFLPTGKPLFSDNLQLVQPTREDSMLE